MRFRSLLALLLLSAPAGLAAQSPFAGDGGVSAGLIYKRYSFGSTYLLKNVEQIAVPVGVVIPVAPQFSVDIGTYYASTTAHDTASGSHKLNGFTDTQVRGSYVFGNQRVVLSLMLNLPTGKEKQTLEEVGVASAISSNFLLFPVASYGNGFSGTLGAAVAVPAGGWNLGLSASGRLSAKYHPYSDSSLSNLEYKPGPEFRIRVGADRLISSSRLSLGFTLSTFSNDQSSGDISGAPASGDYRPATRYISQASLTSPVGNSTLAVYAWDYYRAGSDDDIVPGATKENVFTAGAQVGIPVSPKVTIQPLIEARLLGSAPSNGSGFLFGGGATARLDVAPRFSLIPGARYDTGHIKSDAIGKPSINGFEASLRFRYSM